MEYDKDLIAFYIFCIAFGAVVIGSAVLIKSKEIDLQIELAKQQNCKATVVEIK